MIVLFGLRMNCPCQSGRAYDQCCGPFISQERLPANAEQLMRSRYSAFVLQDETWLESSWHPDHRPDGPLLDPSIRWLGLEVIACDNQAASATIEFEARLLARDRVDAVHERSEFVCEQGRWYYTRGTSLPPRIVAWKPGRNEICPCGSGRKFKRCCATQR